MLVITALVGTNGLEQIVYIGLNDGNFGVGMVAGISMATIAIITDRATKAGVMYGANNEVFNRFNREVERLASQKYSFCGFNKI